MININICYFITCHGRYNNHSY